MAINQPRSFPRTLRTGALSNRSLPYTPEQRPRHRRLPTSAPRRRDDSLPLIMTKVQLPPLTSGAIARERLLRQLTHGTQQALTLLIAPAGYGKTTLLSDWAHQTELPVAWLSLDPNDDMPDRFWSYVLAALEAAQPGVSGAARASSSGDGALESMLVTLINILTTASPMVLVLDDYQLIQADCIHQSLMFLLDHIPETLHIVIASRAEPPLQLARRRFTDTLAELGVNDLQFTHDEAALLLAEHIDQPIADADIAQLLERTEGWAAGLRLALRSARNTEIAAFLRSFNGSHRDIQDYFDEQVLDRLSADVQAFLLQTSVAGRLSAALCEHLWADGTENDVQAAHAMLMQIERSGLFLQPLDAERGWYRYHPLFAEALRYRLQQAMPEQFAMLHAEAEQWLVQHHEAAEQPASTEPILSTREMEVLQLVAAGYANRAIAQKLIIGVNTVKMHLQHLYDKLDVHNRVQAIQRARMIGIL